MSRNKSITFREQLLEKQLMLVGFTVDQQKKINAVQLLYEGRLRELERDLDRERFLSAGLLRDLNAVKEELHLCNKAHEEARDAGN